MMMMENGERNDGMGVLRVISSIVKLRGEKKARKSEYWSERNGRCGFVIM